MSTSSILGQYEANQSLSATTDRVATDKDTFLKLLVAQLTHQDPLNPVEDKEFIAQLAQFTTVEELQKLNTGMEQLNESYLASQVTNAASLIGLEVIAGGDNIYLSGASDFAGEDDYPVIYYTLPYDMAEGTFNVYSSTGALVYSYSLDAKSAGLHAISWPGTNSAGQVQPDGSYIASFSAKDADGNNMLVSTSSNGVVIGVETSADGNHTLYLNDNRTVSFNEVQLITYPRSASGDNSGGDDDGNSSGGDDNSSGGDDNSSGGDDSGSGGDSDSGAGDGETP